MIIKVIYMYFCLSYNESIMLSMYSDIDFFTIVICASSIHALHVQTTSYIFHYVAYNTIIYQWYEYYYIYTLWFNSHHFIYLLYADTIHVCLSQAYQMRQLWL